MNGGNWRMTGGLFVVLVLLAGVAYWQSQQEPEPDPTPTPGVLAPTPVELVSGIETADILSLEITDLTSGEERIFEQESAGIWVQTVPTYTKLITTTLQGQMSGLTRFTSSRSIDANVNPLDAYGLDAPQLKFVLRAEREGQTVRYVFKVGNQTPTNSGYYIQREGDERVHVVFTTNVQNMRDLLEAPPFPLPEVIEE